MSGIRSITRRGAIAGYPTAASAPIYVNSTDNSLRLIPNATGSTELVVALAATSSGFRTAVGTGTLVSGTVVVATGLTTVLGWTASLSGTGATAAGATEVDTLFVSSITTGAVTVAGSYHSGTTAVQAVSVSGTASFYWLAFGT
jgi:hypothetical protein